MNRARRPDGRDDLRLGARRGIAMVRRTFHYDERSARAMRDRTRALVEDPEPMSAEPPRDCKSRHAPARVGCVTARGYGRVCGKSVDQSSGGAGGQQTGGAARARRDRQPPPVTVTARLG